MLNHVGYHSDKVESRKRKQEQDRLKKIAPIANLRLNKELGREFMEIVNLGKDNSLDAKQAELNTRVAAQDFAKKLLDDLLAQEGEMLEVFGAADRNQGLDDFISWQSSFPIGIGIPTSLQTDTEKAVAAIGVAATIASFAIPGPGLPIKATLAGMAIMSALISAAFSSKERNNVIFVANFMNYDLVVSDTPGLSSKLIHYPADMRIPAAESNSVYIGVFVISDTGAGDPRGIEISGNNNVIFSLGCSMDYRDNMLIEGKNKVALGWEKTGSAKWDSLKTEIEDSSLYWVAGHKDGVHVGARIVSTEKDNNGDYYEPGDAWFPKTMVSVQPTSQPDSRESVAYSVTVKTANVTGAGTDSNIQINIEGTQGTTGWIRLNQKMSGNAFEKNAEEHVELGSALDVGTFTKVHIHHDGEWSGSSWNLDWIKVADGRGQSRTFQYDDNSDIDDVQIELT